MIGDRYCDVAAAQAAGARGAMVLTGEAGSDRAKFPSVTPDLIAPTLAEAVARILEQMA